MDIYCDSSDDTRSISKRRRNSVLRMPLNQIDGNRKRDKVKRDGKWKNSTNSYQIKSSFIRSQERQNGPVSNYINDHGHDLADNVQAANPDASNEIFKRERKTTVEHSSVNLDTSYPSPSPIKHIVKGNNLSTENSASHITTISHYHQLPRSSISPTFGARLSQPASRVPARIDVILESSSVTKRSLAQAFHDEGGGEEKFRDKRDKDFAITVEDLGRRRLASRDKSMDKRKNKTRDAVSSFGTNVYVLLFQICSSIIFKYYSIRALNF